MKRIILICMLIVLAIPAWSCAGMIGPARIRFVDGDVMFRTPDSGEWLPAAINTPLDEGDTVWCPDGSKVEIQLADGSMVRLAGTSQLDLLANEDGFAQLHLARGRLYLRTAQNSARDSLQIDADDTTVLPDARTRLRIDMLPNNQEDVAIFKGSAYVEGNGGRTRVRAGDHIALEEGHSELLPLNPPDSWENWNIERDRIQSRSSRADSYLPDELRGYSAELDSSGAWTDVPEYGMVWRPSVVVSDDWAPYRSGRWIWRGNDYVWISFESWGWVPYHFGRWAVVAGFGWCWVPPVRGDVYWGPGYVGWYRTGSHIGWTPLAPGETFYGYGQYGRHSVNITNTTITNVSINYRNRNHRGGLTILPQNDFLRGRTTPQQPSRTPSASVSVSIGSPRIQPLRETRMPIIKQTPPRVAPPRIEHRDSRELRQRFQRLTAPADPQRRQQQPAAVTTTAPAPGAQTAPVKDRRTVYPATTTPQPAPQAVPQPAPQSTPQPTPATRGNVPQHVEPQSRNNVPAATPQQAASPAQRSAQQPRTEPARKEQKQKKVWKVTTPTPPPEAVKEKDSREKEHGGKDNRNK